jgi:hypothetical protein
MTYHRAVVKFRAVRLREMADRLILAGAGQ